MRVNCLYRVSSKQQLHEDDIPVQRAECMEFISRQKGWEFQKEYLEKAVSGYKTSVNNRDVLLEILKDAKDKKFDILLVYMSDRLGRKEDETPAYVANLNNLGIEVWTVKEGQLKTAEHIDKLLNYIRFWQAEGESRKTGMRVKSAQETMAKQGKFIGGKAPYGYDLVYSGEISNKGRALMKYQINNEQAEVVRKIFEYAVNYGYGAFKIAKTLNEEGIKPINDAWKACTINQILQNPVYKGYIAYNRRQRSESGGAFERLPMENWIVAEEQNPELVIVSEKIWNKAIEIREKHKSDLKKARDSKNGTYSTTTKGTLALMGIIYCGYCGNKLTNGSRYDYWTTKDGERKKKIVGKYRCTNKANATMLCNGKTLYRADEIEPLVYKAITKYLNTYKELEVYDEIIEIQEKEREKLKKKLHSINSEISTNRKDIKTLEENIPKALRGDSPISAEKLSSLIKDKEQKIQLLQNDYDLVNNEYEAMRITKDDLKAINSIVYNWSNLFMDLTIPEKKVVLGKLIERIDVREEDIRIKFKITLEDYLGVPSAEYIPQLLPRKTIDFHLPE